MTSGSDWYNQSGDSGGYNPYAGVMDIGEALGAFGGFGIEEGASGALTAAEVNFVPNPALPMILSHSQIVAEGLAEIVEPASKVAFGIAPYKTGAYRDSIGWAIVDGPNGKEGLLYATDYKSIWIEFGTGPRPQAGMTKFPAYAVLRRAIESTQGFMKKAGMI